MKKLKLPDIAPYSGMRVQPFEGVKRYMSTGDLKGDNLNFEDVTYESKPSRADILVSEGDILFAKMTNTNKALRIDKELDGIIVSTGFSVHRPLENELFGEYFLHFLKNNSFQRQKNKLCTGAIQSAISNSGIEKIFVPVPDYKDQLHIANLLSKAENLIAQRKESIRLLDEFLKSTFLEMFGDGKTNVKGFPIVKIEDISTEIKDGPHVSPKYSETGIPIFSSRNIKPGELVMEEIKYVSEEMYLELTKRFKPQRDDVLVTKGGTTGFAKVVDFDFPFCIWVHIAAIRPSKKVVPIYLEHYINSDYGYYQTQKNTKGAANRDLGLKKIAKIEMPLPPIELQTQFAQIVEKTEALKTQYQHSLQELENLYGSLSQKAFKGELSLK